MMNLKTNFGCSFSNAYPSFLSLPQHKSSYFSTNPFFLCKNPLLPNIKRNLSLPCFKSGHPSPKLPQNYGFQTIHTLQSNHSSSSSTLNTILCKSSNSNDVSAPTTTRIIQEYPIREWISRNDSLTRSFPLFVGSIGGIFVILNRVFSGIAPIADASSSQSRADVLCLVLCATLLLNGLVWKSIQPVKPLPVVLEGVERFCMNKEMLPPYAQKELIWFWESINGGMKCQSLLFVFKNKFILFAGIMSGEIAEIMRLEDDGNYDSPNDSFLKWKDENRIEEVESERKEREDRNVSSEKNEENEGNEENGENERKDRNGRSEKNEENERRNERKRNDDLMDELNAKVNVLLQGTLCSKVMKSEKAMYLANLVLFPGRFELFDFFPSNTQAALIQPIGDDGILIMVSDTIRGFTPIDQAWIAILSQKLDSTLEDCFTNGED